MEWFFLLPLLLAILTLVTSVGLLKRREWARRTFIGLMGFGVLWQVGGFALHAFMQREMLAGFGMEGMPPEARSMMLMMTIITATIGVAFALLFGWIIHRLTRPAIAMEFQR